MDKRCFCRVLRFHILGGGGGGGGDGRFFEGARGRIYMLYRISGSRGGGGGQGVSNLKIIFRFSPTPHHTFKWNGPNI